MTYRSCPNCGEWFGAALRKTGLCHNCSDRRHRRGQCSVCRRTQPVELHHIAGRKASPITMTVCLNCHAVLSRLQQHWRAEDVVARTAQGMLDVAYLYYQRLPRAAALTTNLTISVEGWTPTRPAGDLDAIVQPRIR